MSDNNELIGFIGNTRLPYYDIREKKTKFKARPALIIGVESDNMPSDLTCLPISKITDERRRHAIFDYELNPEMVKKLKLKFNPSYIRVHKVTTISSKDFMKFRDGSVNIKQSEQGLYKEVEQLYIKFNKTLF